MTFRTLLRQAVVSAHQFVRDCVTPPPAPGPVGLTQLSQEYVMALKYGVTFPPPGAADVATRRLKVSVGGLSPAVTDHPVAAPGTEILVQRGDEVTLTLADVDADGNVSPDGPPLVFTATDTVPPPAPGSLAVTLLDDNAPDA